jgi:hypothetical protein
VEHRPVEIDLVPTQVADLGGPKAMPEGDQDHGGVALTVAVALGGIDQRRGQNILGLRLRRDASCTGVTVRSQQGSHPFRREWQTLASCVEDGIGNCGRHRDGADLAGSG